MEEEIYK